MHYYDYYYDYDDDDDDYYYQSAHCNITKLIIHTDTFINQSH
jgi:hypothetical protein